MIRALAITVSNRAAAGVYADKSGPVLAELLAAAGCDEVHGPRVVPDGEASPRPSGRPAPPPGSRPPCCPAGWPAWPAGRWW